MTRLLPHPVSRLLLTAAVTCAALSVPIPPTVGGVDETPRGEWPLAPRPAVGARFDPPGTRWGAGHRGVDLVGHPAATVRSSLAGTVGFTGRIAGRGVVMVRHGATRTTYEPVRATVTVGDSVDAGDPIGRLETAGSHCFPIACLHWGWLRGVVYLDPLTLVGAQPVRLVPPGGLTPRSAPAGVNPGETRLTQLARSGARSGSIGGSNNRN